MSGQESEQSRLQLLEVEAFPMVWCVSVSYDGVHMFLCRVSHVPFPTILRIFSRQLAHVFIPVSLCKHGCRCNWSEFSVSLYHALILIAVKWLEPVAVDQKILRSYLQPAHSPLHSGYGCIKNIDGVDLFRSHSFDSPCDGFFFDATEDTLESFPSWSPEGDYLYFVSYKAQTTPVVFTPDMQYSLLRVPFNCKTRTFGEKVDTLYNAPEQGGSVSYPRISADGKYLLYTLSDYGTFPIWHDEADLHMMDLTTMEDVDISIWNDDATADSFHNWSSNGRWAIFGSRRVDGRYTRLMIAYMDKDGKPHKPFLLPQEDPRHNTWRLRSYNVPEFIKDKVSLPKEAEKIFCPEN